MSNINHTPAQEEQQFRSLAMVPHVPSDSESDDDRQPPPTTPRPRPTTTVLRLPRRQRSLHRLLGGQKVADVMLWRDRNRSAAILAGATAAWFLFDVAEYNAVTLLCHASLLGMLLLFACSIVAPLVGRTGPRVPEVIVSEQAFREAALAVHRKLERSVAVLYDIACGKDLKKFLSVIGTLWVLAIIGDNCSFTSLVYVVFLCALTFPALYERYETEVDHLVAKGGEDLKKFYRRVDSGLLNKIPRGPVKTRVY